jgi:hypothetical protein
VTYKDALRRTLATAIQALAAWVVVLGGLIISDDLSVETALVAFAASFLVPVATAAQRYFQAFNEDISGV